MYRPPIDPGWDDFGQRIFQGVGAGIGLYQQGQDRADAQNRAWRQDRAAAEERAQAAAQRRRQQELQDLELGVIDEGEAFENVAPPSIDQAVRGSGADQFQQRMNMGGPGTRRLRSGVIQAGGRYIDPSRSLRVRQADAEADVERRQRETEYVSLVDRLVGMGRTREQAAREALQAVHRFNLPATLEERVEEARQLTVARREATRDTPVGPGRTGGNNGGRSPKQTENLLRSTVRTFLGRNPNARDSTDPFMASDLPFRGLGNARVREIFEEERALARTAGPKRTGRRGRR